MYAPVNSRRCSMSWEVGMDLIMRHSGAVHTYAGVVSCVCNTYTQGYVS